MYFTSGSKVVTYLHQFSGAFAALSSHVCNVVLSLSMSIFVQRCLPVACPCSTVFWLHDGQQIDVDSAGVAEPSTASLEQTNIYKGGVASYHCFFHLTPSFVHLFLISPANLHRRRPPFFWDGVVASIVLSQRHRDSTAEGRADWLAAEPSSRVCSKANQGGWYDELDGMDSLNPGQERHTVGRRLVCYAGCWLDRDCSIARPANALDWLQSESIDWLRNCCIGVCIVVQSLPPHDTHPPRAPNNRPSKKLMWHCSIAFNDASVRHCASGTTPQACIN